MLLGVFSDVHDNVRNLETALQRYAESNVRTLVFCGDFCSPIPARVIGGYDGDIHCVFGNGDGDRFAISNWAAANSPRMQLHGEHAELSLGGVDIAVTHYPLYGRALARTGEYDAVFSGHTHRRHEERFGKCLWLNPGEVLGYMGEATCAIYDTESRGAEIIIL